MVYPFSDLFESWEKEGDEGMKLEIGKHYKIILKNNHIYRGRLLSQKDKLIELYDFKFKDAVMISIDAIFEIITLKADGDLSEFNH